MDRLGATQSRMSRHLARLKAAGLLTDRRDAQWVRYRRDPFFPAGPVVIVDAILSALPALPPALCQKKAA
jgi:ArsR family transcriptional regulator